MLIAVDIVRTPLTLRITFRGFVLFLNVNAEVFARGRLHIRYIVAEIYSELYVTNIMYGYSRVHRLNLYTGNYFV